jgi:putative transposase
MPRPHRLSPGGLCYHVINRGNGRAKVFRKEADFTAFLRILSLACERVPMRLLGWCLMHNHFHLVLWPYRDGDLPRWMQWVTTCHVRRYHRHYKGSGHVWQGRYKSFPSQNDAHLLTVLRYVERNPVRAGLVARAEDWAYSSAGSLAELERNPFAGGGLGKGSGSFSAKLLAEKEPDPLLPAEKVPDPLGPERARPLEDWLVVGPAPRPAPWLKFVNREQEEAELARLRESVNRGSPFGDDAWRVSTARKLGLGSTLRPRGRPRQDPEK